MQEKKELGKLQKLFARVKPILKYIYRHIVIITAFLITIGYCTILLYHWNFSSIQETNLTRSIDAISNFFYDMRLRTRGLEEPSDDIVIVTCDQDSLEKVGRWPWPREYMAIITDELVKLGASAVSYDIIFGEEDTNNAFMSLNRVKTDLGKLGLMKNPAVSKIMEENISKANTDWFFAKTIEKHSENIILGFVNEGLSDPFSTMMSGLEVMTQEQVDEEPEFEGIVAGAIPIITGETSLPTIIEQARSLDTNLPMLSEQALYHAFFNADLSRDGVIRNAFLVSQYGKTLFPSMALQTAALHLKAMIRVDLVPLVDYGDQYSGIGTLSFISTEDGETILRQIPVTQDGKIPINYYGPDFMFPHISMSDFLDPELKVVEAIVRDKDTGFEKIVKKSKSEFIKGKIAVLGATATGLYDLRTTPFEENFPGVEVHANIMSNLLKQNYLVRPQDLSHWILLLIVIFGLIYGFVLGKISSIPAILLMMGLLGAFGAADYFFLFVKGTVFDIYIPILHILFVFVPCLFLKYVTEERQKKAVRGAFSQYVSQSIVNEMLKDSSKLQLGGERKKVSILFSDIRSFTTISEALDPHQLSVLLNRYLSPMTDLLIKHDGTLDKYMGDAIMAFFGAPIEQLDHAKRACQTAYEMRGELAKLNEMFVKEDYPALNIGIGISSGMVSVGNMGSHKIFDYTVIGDTVNLASRLEGINKEYGTMIVLSETTLKETEGSFIARPLDVVKVKGKNEPVKIFELLGPKGDVGGIILEVGEMYTEAMGHYLAGDFSEALGTFQAILKVNPDDGPSKVFVERCGLFMETPPPEGWDGVFTMTRK